MPISKNEKLYYTDEQYRKAIYETTALEYAQRHTQLIKQGSYYTHPEHDSLMFTPNGKFFWNSMKISGSAVDYACFVEGKSFVEAVLAVSGENENQNTYINSTSKKPIPNNNAEDTEPLKTFTLPEAETEKPTRLFAYLCNERKIDNKIVSTLLHEKSIYQSKKYGNIVFVGYDENGDAKSAYQRGTLTFVKKPFKCDVELSDKKIPFLIKSDIQSDTVLVFEAAIDAMSHATLIKYSNTANWRDVNRIALGGVYEGALLHYLKHNENIKNVCLCLDNDKAGAEATQIIGKMLTDKQYSVSVLLPNNKDFNEDLKDYNRQEYQENRLALLYQNNIDTESLEYGE